MTLPKLIVIAWSLIKLSNVVQKIAKTIFSFFDQEVTCLQHSCKLHTVPFIGEDQANRYRYR